MAFLQKKRVSWQLNIINVDFCCVRDLKKNVKKYTPEYDSHVMHSFFVTENVVQCLFHN